MREQFANPSIYEKITDGSLHANENGDQGKRNGRLRVPERRFFWALQCGELIIKRHGRA